MFSTKNLFIRIIRQLTAAAFCSPTR